MLEADGHGGRRTWGEGVTDVNYTAGPARDERADDRKELLGGGAGLER